ncbi:MAG: hypothetical protein WD876_03555 [Candidatus Pacearchaeota archaeon]
MGKLATPDWIKEGYDSKTEYEKAKGIKGRVGKTEGKIFKIRKCPKCGSDKVNVVLTGEEGKGARDWECKNCEWVGKNIVMDEVSEDEFMKYLDERGEPVA